jgi:hypothetical protein
VQAAAYPSVGQTSFKGENMNISDLKREYDDAGTGWLRAAFGSIVRRNYHEIRNMTPDERRRLIKEIGAPDTYMTELSKELKGIEYDMLHGYI